MSRSIEHRSPRMTLTTCALRRAIRCAVLGATLAVPVGLLGNVQPVLADSLGATTFDIPAGSLDNALAQFAARAGVTVSFDPAHARGLKSPGLHGQYDVDSGLRQLLAGSRLQALRQANGSYSLLPLAGEGAMQLDSTNITGTVAESAWGAVDGYVASRSASATKTDTAILEIPQSINVVTAAQVETQGARNLTQARATPPA